MNSPKDSFDSAFCDNQRLNETVYIQPFGILIILEKRSLKIVQVSSNAETVLGKTPDKVLGTSFRQYLSNEHRDSFPEELAIIEPSRQITSSVSFNTGSSYFCSISEADECLMIEIEFANEITAKGDNGNVNYFKSLHHFKAEISSRTTLLQVCNSIAATVAKEMNYDRTMIYRFDDDLNGEVIAEHISGDCDSFLGLWFPAGDIPKPARDLYQKIPVRSIYSVDYVPTPLIPSSNTVTGKPTNLSNCRLRAIMPVHLQYLRNMGICASASIRIMHDDRLWGLIICHHKSPRILTLFEVEYLEFISTFCSSQISEQIGRSEKTTLNTRREYLRKMESEMERFVDVVDGLAASAPAISKLLGVSSAVSYWDGKITCLTNAVPDKLLKIIGSWLNARRPVDIFSSSTLVADLPEAADYADVASGILVIPIDAQQLRFVVLFRPEQVVELEWAGNPNFRIATDFATGSYHPRNSFKRWIQTVRNTCKKWSNEEIVFANRVRAKIIERTMLEYSIRLEGIVYERTSEVIAAKNELERVHEELRQITYLSTHHIQEAVRKINMSSHLLTQKIHDENLQPALRIIVEESNQIRHLICELERYSRSGEEGEFTSIDLNAVAAGVSVELKDSLERNKINLSISALPVVDGIQKQLSELFYILLENAVKFSRYSKAPEIAIFLAEAASDEDYHTIIVEDNGIGIDEAYGEEAFSLFRKMHDDPRFEGNGLGLAVARKIVATHNGHISIRRSNSGGARVEIKFSNGEKSKSKAKS